MAWIIALTTIGVYMLCCDWLQTCYPNRKD